MGNVEYWPQGALLANEISESKIEVIPFGEKSINIIPHALLLLPIHYPFVFIHFVVYVL